MQNLADIIKAQVDMFITPQSLAAVWLQSSVMTGQGKTCRLAPKATICIKDGAIINCDESNKPTHKVIACYGTLIDQFELTLIRLSDNEPSILKI